MGQSQSNVSWSHQHLKEDYPSSSPQFVGNMHLDISIELSEILCMNLSRGNIVAVTKAKAMMMVRVNEAKIVALVKAVGRAERLVITQHLK